MVLNKIQESVYIWLLERPGYLKCSPKVIVKNHPTKVDIKHVIIALEQARIEFKNRESAKQLVKKVVVEWKSIRTKSDKIVITNDFGVRSKIRGHRYQTPGMYIVIGCAHAPFHLAPAFKAVQQLLSDNKSNIVGLVLDGDFLDMNSLSSHDKGRKPIPGVTLDWEYKESEILLNSLLDPLAANIEKVFIYGNHCDRYKRYMSDIDNSKLGASLASPIEGLKLIQKGFDIYDNWKEDFVTLGYHLDVSHGEFYNVHSAKKHIDTYRRSILYYHTHRVQQYIEGAVGGYNGGSMADFNAPVFGYASRAMKNSWLNGFNAVHVDEQGFYHIQQIVCYNNRFVFGNTTYKY